MENNEFNIFFSGVEGEQVFANALSFTKNILMSFHTIKRRGENKMQERLDSVDGLRLIIDSGGYTFLTNTEKYKQEGEEFWQEYLKRYTKFVEKNKDKVLACVELDLDVIVGQEKVEQWRREYFEPLEDKGIQVIYVWHPQQGIEEWERMCKKYAYVGFSFHQVKSEDEVLINKLFNIAKTYKAKVQAFACTSAKALMTYPFVSVDSTTWLVGSQFGEILFAEKDRMIRLKKEKWKKEYKRKLITLGAKWSLMEAEAPYELTRVNGLSMTKFESYVQSKWKNRRYWLGREKNLHNDKDLDYKLLPKLEWFNTEMADWKEYAEALRMDTEMPDTVGKAYLMDMYNFCKETETIPDYTLEELVGLCRLFNDYASNTLIKCVNSLKKLFKEQYAGKRDDLKNISENVQVGQKMALEREKYIEEKNYVDFQLTKEECNSFMTALLTTGDSSLDNYDKELIKNGITPIRNLDGELQGGIKKIRKNKKLYSTSLPKLACDTCYKGMDCPQYKQNHVCAYDKLLKRFNARDTEDVLDALQGVFEVTTERTQRMLMFENLDGGVASKQVTDLLDKTLEYGEKLLKLRQLGDKITAEKRVIVDNEGNTRITTTVTSNPKQSGLLSKLFGVEEDSDIIETTVV